MKRMASWLCALAVMLSLTTGASAASTDREKTMSIPVTVSVVHTAQSIDVTLPASLPEADSVSEMTEPGSGGEEGIIIRLSSGKKRSSPSASWCSEPLARATVLHWFSAIIRSDNTSTLKFYNERPFSRTPIGFMGKAVIFFSRMGLLVIRRGEPGGGLEPRPGYLIIGPQTLRILTLSNTFEA